MVVLSITDIGINLPVLLAQTVNFIVLLTLLRLVAYKPILKILDERKARIQRDIDALKREEHETRDRIERLRREEAAVTRKPHGRMPSVWPPRRQLITAYAPVTNHIDANSNSPSPPPSTASRCTATKIAATRNHKPKTGNRS